MIRIYRITPLIHFDSSRLQHGDVVVSKRDHRRFVIALLIGDLHSATIKISEFELPRGDNSNLMGTVILSII